MLTKDERVALIFVISLLIAAVGYAATLAIPGKPVEKAEVCRCGIACDCCDPSDGHE